MMWSCDPIGHPGPRRRVRQLVSSSSTIHAGCSCRYFFSSEMSSLLSDATASLILLAYCLHGGRQPVYPVSSCSLRQSAFDQAGKMG
jgi:hypothetical protein